MPRAPWMHFCLLRKPDSRHCELPLNPLTAAHHLQFKALLVQVASEATSAARTQSAVEDLQLFGCICPVYEGAVVALRTFQ